MNRQKLQNLLKVFTPDETAPDFSVFDNEFQTLKDKLKEKVTVKTLEDVNVQLEKSRKQTAAQIDKLNFQPLLDAFDKLKTDLEQNSEELVNTLNNKQSEFSALINQSSQTTTQTVAEQNAQIEQLLTEVAILSVRKIEIPDFAKQIKESESKLLAAIETAKVMDELQDEKEKEQIQIQFANFEKQFKELKLQFLKRGGGSMNRKISIAGTVMSTKYTDINFVSGVTATDNNTTKQVDLTISGGSGGSSLSYETPSGTIDGSNRTFTVANTPVLLQLGPNVLALNVDYTYSAGTITTTVAPQLNIDGSTPAFISYYNAASTGSTIYSETPQGLINDVNTVYTTLHTINTVLSFAINGQFIHPSEYGASGTQITFVTALPAVLSGTSYTIVYI